MFRDEVGYSFALVSAVRILYWNLMAVFFKLLYEEDAEGHHSTAHCGRRPLPFTGALPKHSQQSSFLSVQEAGCQGSDRSTSIYKQQDYSQQTLKIENGRHSEAQCSWNCMLVWLVWTWFPKHAFLLLPGKVCLRDIYGMQRERMQCHRKLDNFRW